MAAWMWWAIGGGVVVFALALHGYLLWDLVVKARALQRDVAPLQQAVVDLSADISGLTERVTALREGFEPRN